MGFYGKVTNSSKAQFSFDRTYSNRVAMDNSVNNDSVFVNRYVLIEYDQTPFTDRPIPNAMPLDYQYQAYYLEIPEENIAKGLYTDPEGTMKYKPTKLGEVVWVPALKNKIDETEKIFVITSFTNSERYEFEESAANTNYITNFNYDKDAYGPSRGYDSTVWQKTYNNGEYKYVMVAELNSVVPSFTVSQDAPTLSPITPHFDENSTNVLYNLHVQPQWGFRLKKATPPTLREINSLTGEEMGEDLNRGQWVYDMLPSDETMSWTKEEYDKKLHTMRKYYYDENGEWREYLGNGPIAHNLQSAVYYYKDGFDSEIITSPEFDEDYIRLEASGKSGHTYNTHKNNGNEIAEDIQELSIMLPSIGKAVAHMWDIIYGGAEAYTKKKDESDKEETEEEKEKKSINCKEIFLTREDFNRIKYTGKYRVKNNNRWEEIEPSDEYNPGAIYGKAYGTYLKRNQYMEWEDGTTQIEDIQLSGLRLINRDRDGFSYNVEQVKTLAGSINSVHDLMGMIIVNEKSSKRNDWTDYINNSSDSRIYYTSFEDLKDDEQPIYTSLKKHRYYRRVKDIQFTDITVNKNSDGSLILTDDKKTILQINSDNITILKDGVVQYTINKNNSTIEPAITSPVELGIAGGDKVILNTNGEISRYNNKQIITKSGAVKLNSFTPIDLKSYNWANCYIRIKDTQLNKYSLVNSGDKTAVEGKTYYMPKTGESWSYWNKRLINLLNWIPNTHWALSDKTYYLDSSDRYDGGEKYSREHVTALNEIYFPNKFSDQISEKDSNYYLQLIDPNTNKPYWFLVQNITYTADNGATVFQPMPLFNLQVNDTLPFGTSLYNDFAAWLSRLRANGDISEKLYQEYLQKHWKFGGYFKMKLTQSGSGNSSVSGIIRPENQYKMRPYEQVNLINPYDSLENNKYNFYKVENYAPANFVDINELVRKSSVNKFIDYIKLYPEIKLNHLYLENKGQIVRAQDFLQVYFRTALNSNPLEGYSSDVNETDGGLTVVIKDSENNLITEINYDDPITNVSQEENPALFEWCTTLQRYLNALRVLSINEFWSIGDYWDSTERDTLLAPLNDMTFHLYFSIWNKYGRTVYDRYNAWHEHFGNKVLLDVDGYKSNYYYVRRYKYIQLNSEEEFNNFKSSHDLYTATYEEEPLDTENKTINDLPSILFYKLQAEEGEEESVNNNYVLNNVDYIDPDKEYYTGELIKIPEDEEFDESKAYYYLDYVVSKNYRVNDLYFKAGSLTLISEMNSDNTQSNQIKYNNLYNVIYDNYDKNANYVLASFDSATKPVRLEGTGKTVDSAFFEPYKYYYHYSNETKYSVAAKLLPPPLDSKEKLYYYKDVDVVNDFEPVSSDQFYVPNKYYEELAEGSGIYTLASSDDMRRGATYYIGENYYIISDDSGLYQPGAIWNLEVPVPSSVHLGIMKPFYTWKELPHFGRTLNTINGLILKMNQMLEWDNKLTRDTNTAQGCINMLNDIIGKFGAMRPADLLITDSRGRVVGSDYSMIQNDKLTNYGKINNYAPTNGERTHEFATTYEKALELNHIEDNDLARDRKGRWLSLEVKNYSLLNKYYTTEDEIINSLQDDKFVCSEVRSNGTELGTIKEVDHHDLRNLHYDAYYFRQFYYKVKDLLTDYDYQDYRNKLQYKNADAVSSQYLGDLYYYDSENKVHRVSVNENYDPNRDYLLKVNLTTKDWEDNKVNSIEELKHRLVSVNSIIELKHEKYNLPNSEFNLDTTTDSNKNKTFADAWEHEGKGNNQNGNKDTIELYAPIVDDMGHIVGRNTETVTLPYGYKHIKTAGQSTEVASDLFTTSYSNTDTSGASETKTPVASSGSNNSANNTQDILSINPGNKWIQLKADDNTNSLTIAHEVHTVNRLTDSTDLNNKADSYSNSKDKITVQDIEFDNAGHVVTNRKHTYTLPYSYKQFTTSQDTSVSAITQNTSTTTADNTQDKVTFKMGNKWLNSRVDNDLITFAHETHWTSDNDNVSYPGNNNTNRTDAKTTTSSNLNGVEDFTVESYKFDNAGHVISHNTHTYELPHNYSFIDLIGTTGSTNFIDGTGSSGSPTVLSALEAKSRFSMYAGNRWITIKGTDTNGDKVNDSITFSHAAAGTAVNTKGDSNNRVLDYGSTFNTIRTGIDEAGHVSVLEQYSVKLPTQSIGGTGNVVTNVAHSNNDLAFTHAQLMDLALSNSTTATTVATAPAFNGSTQNHTSILSTDTLQAALGKVPNMIQDSIRDIINASDTSLDTLKEIADWISKDPNNTALNNYKSLVELEKDVYGLNGNALKAYNGTISLQDRTASLETSKTNLYSMLGNVDGYNPNATYPDGTTKGTLENRVNWAETQINRYVTDDLKNKVDAAWDLLQTVQQTTGNIQNSTDGYMKYHMGPTAPTDADGNVITNAMWIDTTDPNNVLVKFPLISSVDSNGNPQGITWLAINTWQ